MVYINIPTRKVGVLSSPSAATAELQALVGELLRTHEARRYFSPPLHRQLAFCDAEADDLFVTDDTASQVLSLPTTACATP